MASADEFRRYLAESGQQSKLDQIQSIPGGFEQALAEYNRGESSSSTPGYSASPATADFRTMAQDIIGLQQKANQPAIQALQATIPTTEQSFAQKSTQLTGEIDPLKQRYQSLLDEITRRETAETSAATRAGSREFAGRGLLPSGGGFEQYLGERVSPISQFYTGQTRETGLAREDTLRSIANAIANVPIEKQQSLDAIANAIAQLQSGAASSGIGNALTLYQAQQSNVAQEALRKLQERELALKENAPFTLSEGTTIYDPKTGKAIYTAPKTYKPEEGTSGMTAQDFLNLFSGGAKAPSSFVPDPSSSKSSSYKKEVNYYG